MRVAVLASLLLLVAAGAPAAAQSGPSPWTADFETDPGLMFQPAGGWTFAPVREGAPQGEVFARLAHAGPEAPPAMAVQSVNAAPWTGQPIRLSAWLRVNGEAGPLAGLWLRIDGITPGRQLFFDNMADRPVVPGAWARHEIVAWVPEDAGRIVFGVLKSGPGSLDVDDVVLAVADPGAGDMSPGARAYLDEALEALRTRHINRASVDWGQIRDITDRLASGAAAPSDVHPALRVAIGMLGERHTLLLGPPAAPGSPGSVPAPMPRGEAPAPGFGLLALPERMASGADDPLNETYRSALVAVIEGLEARGTCGWIIDLRGNGGGNMWPMLNGLEPLLGTGPFGAFGDADTVSSRWVRRGERIVDEAVNGWDVADGTTGRLAGAPVAVLLGPGTASSGEMTAIAFRSRARTRTFGAPTAGLTTANAGHRLPDGFRLLITTTGAHDGNGVLVTGRLAPDEATAPNETLPRALEWLATQGCAGGAIPA